MKCSPFARGLRKGGKYMHHHRGKFIKHLMRGGMDGYDSSSSSSSSEDCHRDQTVSGDDRQQRMEHGHGMKSKLRRDKGMEHGMRHGHDMMHERGGHGMRHGHGMMHRMEHGHDMRHGHGMMHRMEHGHDMRHGKKYWHDMKHGKSYDHFMEHRMKHRHGMKHKMHHGHGRKHKMGHGPGMHHKMRYEADKSCLGNQNEERSLDVDIESSEKGDVTFYKPKTSAEVMTENNKFRISLPTSYYQPEEVSVKIVNTKIDVSAMHESMEDDIYEFHEMYRSFNIPSNVNPEVITAHLDAEGKLIIEAVCNDQEESSPAERDIQVIRMSQ